MSFEEGFDAIAKVKASGEKLGETVNRIAELEGWLSQLYQAHNQAEDVFKKAALAIDSLQHAVAEITERQKELQEEVQTLPEAVRQVLLSADQRLAAQQEENARMMAQFPAMINDAIDTKLTAIVSQMEVRLSERLRDELKDTRITLRDTLEYGNNRTEMRLDEIKKEIIAELPRGLFGRRKG